MKAINHSLILMLLMCSSCIENPLDSKADDQLEQKSRLRAILSKSSPSIQEDSLTMMSKIQKDADHIMMNQIVFKDSIFILNLKPQDAAFLGISNEIYARYSEYVTSLNNRLRSNQP